MTKTIERSELDALPVAERLQLLEDVWVSLEQDAEAVPSPDWHLDELDKRLDRPTANTRPWTEVLAELRAKLKS
jgi:putative addiction module component (TIGR02574 family)